MHTFKWFNNFLVKAHLVNYADILVIWALQWSSIAKKKTFAVNTVAQMLVCFNLLEVISFPFS